MMDDDDDLTTTMTVMMILKMMVVWFRLDTAAVSLATILGAGAVGGGVVAAAARAARNLSFEQQVRHQCQRFLVSPVQDLAGKPTKVKSSELFLSSSDESGPSPPRPEAGAAGESRSA